MPVKKKCKQCKTSKCGHLKGSARKRCQQKQKQKQKKTRQRKQKQEFGKLNEPYIPNGKYVRQLYKQNNFGALETPPGMRSVSSFRKAGQYNRPFLEMPFGPPQPWLTSSPQGAASSSVEFGRQRFGSNSLKDRYVNPSGYLSTWYGQPRTPPASWNPLLLQGNNTFRQGINNPKLNQVNY